MARIASFDVFDTVLTRSVGSPYSVFLLLGRRLNGLSLIPCTAEAFAYARIEAHRRAARNGGGADAKVTLRLIYRELGAALGLTEEQCNRLINLEYTLEEELIRSVPGAKRRIQAACDRDQRVVFLSDMYLPATFIQKQLMSHGLWVDGSDCYVSCEYGKSKVSGELFRELIQREGIPSTLVTHCGNDTRGDVQSAQRIGLKAVPFWRANLNQYEQILETHALATEGLSSVMAGASRLARLAVTASSEKQKALRDVAASVVAPMLVGYVVWLLQRAQQLGLQRLYFISRDGQILLEIARRLAGKLNVSCELRYLYGSRRSWLLPAITSINEDQLSILRSFSAAPSVRNLLSRIDIDPDEIRASLCSIGLTDENWSRNLSRNECQALFTLIQEDRRLHNLILLRSAERRALIMRYLKQEGLFNPGAWGMVDVGWAGRLQDALGRILATEGGEPPVGFYFGLKGDSLIKDDKGRKEAYFFNERLRLGFIDLLPRQGLLILLEVFCSGDHGQVIGFQEIGDEVGPMLKEESNDQLLACGLPLIRETVYSFAENLSLDPGLINVEADLRVAIADVLKAFWLNPTVAEARAVADFPCEIGLSDDTCYVRLAEGYRWRHVVNSLLPVQKQRERLPMWYEGSRALTSSHIRVALKIASLASRAWRRLGGPINRIIRSPLSLRKATGFPV